MLTRRQVVCGSTTTRATTATPTTGEMEFPNEVVQDLYAQMQKGEVPKASLAGWRRESKSGNKFLSLSAKIWEQRNGGQQRAPQQRQPDSTPHGRQQERRAPAQQTFDDEIPF